ncbi:MAG: flagellar basal-body rod protein FlgF [Polyangiaceae bacterium]
MSTGIWIAASGASAQMTQLDATANNLANSQTPAFKADRAVFQEYLAGAVLAGNAQSQMRYASVAEVRADTTPGPLRVTQRPLDVSIANDGYFAVQTPNGERYTRAGNFQLGSGGALQTADGHAVLDTGRRPVTVPQNATNLAIDDDGSVTVAGEPIGQLRFVRFNDATALEKDGLVLVKATDGSGAPQVTAAQLQSGALEMPNVSVVKGMTDLVSVTRAFEALQRAVEVFGQLDRRAATDIMGGR